MKCLTVLNWQLDNIENVCADNQKQKFVCMSTHTFFTSSVIWGTLGPARMYGPGKGIYSVTLYGFLVGALLPVPLYVLVRLGYTRFRHIYTPSLLFGGITWAPFNFSFSVNALYLGYFFQVYVKRRFFNWWAKYNVTSYSSTYLPNPLSEIIIVSHLMCSHTWLGSWWFICILCSPIP